MGMSSYGSPIKYYEKFKKLISFKDNKYELNLNFFDFYNFDNKIYLIQNLKNYLEIQEIIMIK